MAESTLSRLKRYLWLLVAVGLILLAAAAIVLTQRAALAAPEQPVAFNHQLHDAAGVQCLFCHTSPLRSDVAGIPSVQRCAGCHRTIATDRPEIQIVMGYWDRGEAIPWQRVADMPDHVFFSHQPHLQSGVSCETCHGPLAEMTVAKPVVVMDMGWCLDCHLELPEDKVGRLADCLACHK